MASKICKSFCFLLLFSLAATPAFTQSTAFDQLKAKFDSSTVFHADFNYVYTDSYTGESNVSNGEIWIDGIGYKLETDDQVLVVDGELSRVYDSIKNRVIISEYEVEEDDFAPSKMLSGIDDTYSVSESRNDAGNVVIALETDDDFADYLTVKIELNDAGTPIRIMAYDFADNESITTFKNGAFIEKTEDMFTLIYPEGAEIVDMRY